MTEIDNALMLKKMQLETVLSALSEADRKKVRRALEVAETAHATQQRPTGGMYIHHPLNVALTVANTFHILDADILCAALLHDTLEDQSETLGREYGNEEDEGQAELTLERLFGHRVARLVHALSNPEVAATSQEAKNVFYKEHVAEIIQDPQVCVVKLADFYDNAFRIDTVPEEKRTHFIAKYGPVIRDVWMPLFERMSETHPLYSRREEILEHIVMVYKNFFQHP